PLDRPLTHSELDNNFDYGNFWESTKSYAEDMVVIHNKEWYRAKQQTTAGTFISGEWERIGGAESTPGSLGVLGLPTDGKYGSDSGINGEFTGIIPGDTVEDAFDKVE